MDHYLKAADESALMTALQAAGIVTEDGVTEGYALDVIGVIYKQVPSTDPDAVEMVNSFTGETFFGKSVLQEGFHANLRGELSEEQAAMLPVIPAPQAPVRVWF